MRLFNSLKSALHLAALAGLVVAAGYVSWTSVVTLLTGPARHFPADLLADVEKVCSLSAACVKVFPVRLAEPKGVDDPAVGFVVVAQGKAADRIKLSKALHAAVAESPRPMTIRLVDSSTKVGK